MVGIGCSMAINMRGVKRSPHERADGGGRLLGERHLLQANAEEAKDYIDSLCFNLLDGQVQSGL